MLKRSDKMNRYTGDECSVCKVTFRDSDDVVVCPVCGTPYHRACYSVESGCVNKEWHGKTTYEQEKAKSAKKPPKNAKTQANFVVRNVRQKIRLTVFFVRFAELHFAKNITKQMKGTNINKPHHP